MDVNEKVDQIIATDQVIKKWTWINNNYDYTESWDENNLVLLKAIPELDKLKSSCGWCEFFKPRWEGAVGCQKCPLGKIGNCFNDGLYRAWRDFYPHGKDHYERRNAAQGILNLAISYKKELEG